MEYLDNIIKIIDMTYLDKNKDFKEKNFEKIFEYAEKLALLLWMLLWQ